MSGFVFLFRASLCCQVLGNRIEAVVIFSFDFGKASVATAEETLAARPGVVSC